MLRRHVRQRNRVFDVTFDIYHSHRTLKAE